MRSSHRIRPISKSIVRDALVGSVAWTRPPVSLDKIHESTVPNARRPARAAARAPGTRRSSHSIFVLEK
jgi:hypothetical protein